MPLRHLNLKWSEEKMKGKKKADDAKEAESSTDEDEKGPDKDEEDVELHEPIIPNVPLTNDLIVSRADEIQNNEVWHVTKVETSSECSEILIRQFTWDIIKSDYTVCMIGRRRSGKTTFVRAMCYNMRHLFPEIVVFTKSTADCEYLKFLPKYCVIEGLRTPQAIAKCKALIKRQKERLLDLRSGKITENIGLLIIIDDCASDGMRYFPELDEIFYEGRHLMIAIFVSFQYVKVIPPGIRDNTDLVVLWPTGSRTTLDAVHESWGGTLPNSKAMIELFHDATQFKHQPLMIHVADLFNDFNTERVFTGLLDMDEIDDTEGNPWVMGSLSMWRDEPGAVDQIIGMGPQYKRLLYTREGTKPGQPWFIEPETYDPGSKTKDRAKKSKPKSKKTTTHHTGDYRRLLAQNQGA